MAKWQWIMPRYFIYCDVLCSHLERNRRDLLKVVDWKQSLLLIKFTFVKRIII